MNLEEIRNACEFCKCSKPHLHYYLKDKVKRFSSFDECHQYVKEKRIKYHNERGKDGFLSERTDDYYISSEAISIEACRIWDEDNLSYDIESIETCDLLEVKGIDVFIK